MQMEKEKQNYDFDNVQSQLDKALGQSTRLQKEKEAVQLEADRLRDKYEKAQVKYKYFLKNYMLIYNYFANSYLCNRLILIDFTVS